MVCKLVNQQACSVNRLHGYIVISVITKEKRLRQKKVAVIIPNID